MNIKKSIRIALAQIGENQVWLSNELGVCRSAISNGIKRDSYNIRQIKKMAEVFEMKVSEFIALGESK